ncbi:MAG: T9SS type A sorting domain-containing protein [candidate division WOR-3 bacterium]
MLKRITIFIFLAFIVYSLPVLRKPYSPEPLPALTGQEIINQPVVITPVTTISPGETCSHTFIDYQQNGTLGDRLSIRSDFRAFVWMHSPDSNSNYPRRWIRYNSYYDNMFQLGEGVEVTILGRSGYCTGGSFSDGRAIAFYHIQYPLLFSVVSTEVSPGSGLFNDPVAIDTITIPPGASGSGTTIWPHGVVGLDDVIHVVSYPTKPPGSASDFYYSRSTDGGNTFSFWMPVIGDTQLSCLSPDIYARPGSPKVLISYTRKIENINPGKTTQIQQNVWYRESPDNGATWNEPVQVTNYDWGGPGSTFPFAYTDVDGIYDLNNNLHLVWTEVWWGLSQRGDTLYAFGSRIMHWSEATGFTVVSGIGNNNAPPGIEDTTLWYMPVWDAWRRPADRPQLAIDGRGILYCVWTGNKDTNDVSVTGRTNGELWLSYSTDNGQTWLREAINLTNSPSPNATPGNCEDDDYHTLWSEVVDGKLHIQYINDKDAGGVPQTEGVVTNNPVLYLQVPVTGILEEREKKVSGSIITLVPNPASNYINLSYYLNDNHRVIVKIADASGRVIEKFDLAGKKGKNSFQWQRPKELKKGIYFISFNLPNKTLTKKLVLQ